jgi:hypothetical protein
MTRQYEEVVSQGLPFGNVRATGFPVAALGSDSPERPSQAYDFTRRPSQPAPEAES